MTAQSRPKPTWQTDECPTWCVTEHRENDHPQDRFHDSHGIYLPAILGIPDETQADPAPEAVELLVVRSRRCGTNEDWVFIGEPDRPRQRLLLSAESAARLITALATTTSEA